MHWTLTNDFIGTRDTLWQDFDILDNAKDHKPTTLKSLQDYPKWTRFFYQNIKMYRPELRLDRPNHDIILGKNYRFLWTWVPLRTTPPPLSVFMVVPSETQLQWHNFIKIATPQHKILTMLTKLLLMLMHLIAAMSCLVTQKVEDPVRTPRSFQWERKFDC